MTEVTRISWWRTTFGEEESRRIADSIAHEHISQGPVTAEFERKLADILDIPYVVATTSGSMAILMALLAAGVGPGDEVIVPNRTWIASAHAPLLLGAKVVLVDVETDRPIIDASQIEKKITSRTKVIMPVHLNGRSADMGAINCIAAAHGLLVVEDAAQALCSRNAAGLLGCQSFAGCFSLSVAKIISTGQGGFVVTRNAETYERLRLMRTHGVSDVVNASYTQMGFNFRFTDILASIGVVQLHRLSDRINKVKAIYAKYAAAMPDFPFLKFIPVDIEAGEIPIYIEVLCVERDQLVKFLANQGIQTRLFYPDLHRAEYFGNSGYFPNSEIFAAQGIFLPCGPEQPLENVDRVLEALRLYGKQGAAI
jgi:dTDP-4-amino-4,6-dideoxygalactose transaminase